MVVLTASHARRSRSRSKVIVLVLYVKIGSKRTFFLSKKSLIGEKSKKSSSFLDKHPIVASLVKLSIARALLEAPIEFVCTPFRRHSTLVCSHSFSRSKTECAERL